MRVTASMRKQFRELAGKVPVSDIAEMFGVSDTTVYYHINERAAAKRRETWRQSQQRRSSTAGGRQTIIDAKNRYRDRERARRAA